MLHMQGDWDLSVSIERCPCCHGKGSLHPTQYNWGRILFPCVRCGGKGYRSEALGKDGFWAEIEAKAKTISPTKPVKKHRVK
jgi:excinuclease UvrABC ATPase subunit